MWIIKLIRKFLWLQKFFNLVLSFLGCTFLEWFHNESELVVLEVSFVLVTTLFGIVIAGVHHVYFVLRLEGWSSCYVVAAGWGYWNCTIGWWGWRVPHCCFRWWVWCDACCVSFMRWLIFVGRVKEVEVCIVSVAFCFFLWSSASTGFVPAWVRVVYLLFSNGVDVGVRGCWKLTYVFGHVHILAVVRFLVIVVLLVGVLWGGRWIFSFLGGAFSWWGCIWLLFRDLDSIDFWMVWLNMSVCFSSLSVSLSDVTLSQYLLLLFLCVLFHAVDEFFVGVADCFACGKINEGYLLLVCCRESGNVRFVEYSVLLSC